MNLRRGLKAARSVLSPALERWVPADGGRELPLSHWGIVRSPRGDLQLREVALQPLLAAYGSPLFVVDEARLVENARDFLRAPAAAQSGVECFYSYKTNPVPGVLARLHAEGVGAEVISEYELWLAQRSGLGGARIVLNGPGRTPAALRTAIELDALLCLNHREEIALVASLARQLGKRARVGMRVVPAAGWTGQFGEPIHDGAALACYRELVRSRELEPVALHAHLGAEVSQREQVVQLGRELVDFAQLLRRELQLQLAILDFGGSLCTPTVSRLSARDLRLNSTLWRERTPRDPATVLGIRDYVAALVQTVEERCREHDYPRPRLFVEPGRALTGDTQLLLCTVTSLKHSGADGLVHAILDAGVNIAEPVRGEYHRLALVDAPEGPLQPYRLVGPICTPMDTLVYACRLPRLKPGSVLAILDAGAYFVPFSTSFSFPQPGIVMVRGGQVQPLRRAETYADLVRRDDVSVMEKAMTER